MDYLTPEKAGRILRNHPEMIVDVLKRIPEVLEDPVLVLKSKAAARRDKTRMVLFGSVHAQNGQPVMTVLGLKHVEGGLVIDDMQKVNSAYTKKNPAAFISTGMVLHADEKEPFRFFAGPGLQ